MSPSHVKPHTTKFSWADGRYAIIAHKRRGKLPEDPALRKVALAFGSIIVLKKR